MQSTHEIYRPRLLRALGQWPYPELQLKVYGLIADDQSLDQSMQDTARTFIENEVLGAVASTGESDGLGFVIVHPGTLGLSVSAYWWTQGSVLCQRFYRKLYDAKDPLNMASRASIGCVWELGIIDAERQIWIRRMMGEMPDPKGYLAEFTNLKEV